MPNPAFNEWLDQLSQYPGLFMTGTDTGVGKTWVGVQLLQQLRARGLSVIPRKPAESGWPDAQVSETDSWKLAACASRPQTLQQVCPHPLRAALSPPRAAQLEGKHLHINELAKQCQQGLVAEDFLYVEGAGGFYSPLAQDGLNADLAQRLGIPVVLVSIDRVGCINQILLTAAAIQQRGLPLAGVILNPLEKNTPEGMDNLSDLMPLLNAAIIRWPAPTESSLSCLSSH